MGVEMSRLDNIAPTGSDGRYKVEIQVEGQWVVMALLEKESINKLADYVYDLQDEEDEGEEQL
jgi:hypothetical protein